MFGGSRRHRPPAQPLTKETANPNAATAAASAFARRDSPSLSSAAAAAALKARPTTPTNVAEVQSKRALRRSPSASSTTSRDRAPRREVQRSPSVGSMGSLMERTFRSPSPGRSPAPRQRDVPPVPPVPTLPSNPQVTSTTKAAPPSQQRKTTNMQSQPFRTASQKLKDGQQGSHWFGAAAATDPSNMRKSDAALRSSAPPPARDDRAGAVSPSINFSYPRSQLDSPDRPRSTSLSEQPLVYDPNSRRMVPRKDLVARQESIREVVDKPAPKKRQDPSRSGSHLSKGTVARTKAPALESHNAPTVHSETAPAPALVAGEAPANELAPSVSREQTLVDTHTEEPAKRDLREFDGATVLPPADAPHAVLLGESPPLVEEEPVLEEDLAQTEEDIADAAPTSVAVGQEPQAVSVALEKSQEEAKSLADEKPKPAETPQHSSVRRARVHSESPARTAHFAATPDQLAIKHEPPSRSLSPRKSAMKHAGPARAASPSDDCSEASAPSQGLGAEPKEDTAVARKKSVRVSFDDQKTVILGESAPKQETDSPLIPSPQAVKKPWHSLVGRYNKKETPALEEDETMAPRPALPLFGSVREKKPREPEERPLVRPSERAWSPPPSSVTVEQPGSLEADLGQSSDVAIGSVFATDQASKNEANISKYREPLPPVVTSIEGSGYASHSDLSSEDELDTDDTHEHDEPTQELVLEGSKKLASETPQEPVLETVGDSSTNGSAVDRKDFAEIKAKENDDVPNVSVTQPSPLAQSEEKPTSPESAYFDVPGGFPDEEENAESPSKSAPATEPVADISLESPAKTETKSQEAPAAAVAQEPEPVTPTRAVESASATGASPVMTDIQEEDEEQSDRSSIYSDAYEDLSDVDGDGFMSLDAVLTTPVKAKVAQKLFEETQPYTEDSGPREAPAMKSAPAADSALATEESNEPPIQTQDDWDKAKAYWRSLTTDKRRQLEVEALDEAGEEADREGEQKQKKKSKRRPVHTSVDASSSAPGQPLDQNRVYQIQPGTKWAEKDSAPQPPASGTGKLRKSMRGAAPQTDHSTAQQPAGGLRKSLRSGRPATADSADGRMRTSLRAEPEASAVPDVGMRKSMRSNGLPGASVGQRPSIKKTDRPVSYQPPPTAIAVEDHKRNHSADPQRPTSAIGSSTIKPPLRRRGSDTSESSFTRARASKGTGLGFRTSMRNSMREPAAAPTSEATKGSGRFSLRSLSPSGSTFRRNSVTASPPQMTSGGRMRQSMRSESGDAGASRKRFSALSGLSSNKKDAKAKRQGNRFADSDSDDDGPMPFSSRFADSSDEEEAPQPQPAGRAAAGTTRGSKSSSSAAAAAMGMPMARIRSESPGLPDSDDEKVAPRRPATSSGPPGEQLGPGLQRSRSGRGTLATSPAPGAIGTQGFGNRPANTRRGSLMSILKRKKDPAGKISREVTESAARRDTKLERSTEQLSMMRSNSNPRLQKRGPNWPLPDETGNEAEDPKGVAADEEKRPSTSGGPAPSTPPRAAFLRRRSTSYSIANTNNTQDDTPGSSKKKKFGALRKMFKLND